VVLLPKSHEWGNKLICKKCTQSIIIIIITSAAVRDVSFSLSASDNSVL
jgi:hypothetical protein